MNFKKVVSVIASAAMLGSTLGFAAAATYPEPFVSGGSANVAIVVGSNSAADPSDFLAATSIGTNLNAATVGSAMAGATPTGESLKIEKSSTKLNLNDLVTTVWTASVTDSDLPTLLADGTYTNDENSEYAYTQKITFGGALTFTHFAHSSHNSKVPDIGFNLAGATEVLNYTLDWTSNPESDSVSGDLADIETTDIVLLGKSYYVLDADNGTGGGTTMTLLDSAATTTLLEGESTTVVVGDKSYTASVNFIGSSTVKLEVDGEITSTLSAGSTQKLKDGSYLGVKEINTQDYAGGTKTVQFSIGNGKLKLTNGSSIELNDDSINDVTAYIRYATSSSTSKGKLDKIELIWKLEDRTFLTPNTELVMPGFGALKLSVGALELPETETTTVDYSGEDVIQLETVIEDGNVTIPLFKMSTTTGNFTFIGEDTDQRLATTNETKLFYDAASGVNTGFVASWNNSKESESYYLDLSVSRDGSSAGNVNRTTITNKVTGIKVCENLQEGDLCSVGSNIEITMTNIDYTSASAKNVNMTINGGGSWQRLYTAAGLAVYLPVQVGNLSYQAQNLGKGIISIENVTAPDGNNAEMFLLWFEEEDKDGTLGNGQKFNMTLDAHSSTAATRKVSVTSVGGMSNTDAGYEDDPSGNSEIYEGYVLGELASRILWDKSSASQYSASVDYHGEEVAGDVWLTAPDSTLGGGTSIVPIYDSEVAGVDSNLIVVGGSCINTVAADLLGSTSPLCGAGFTANTGVGAGEYLIKTFSRTGGKVATLVAGYNAADTVNAANALTSLGLEITAGTECKGSTATACA